jgi:hypothetical protein
MTETRSFVPPDIWMQQVFDAKAAREGGTVRRSLRDIDRTVGRTAFLREIERRGYQAVENSGQIVIFCNAEPIRRFR